MSENRNTTREPGIIQRDGDPRSAMTDEVEAVARAIHHALPGSLANEFVYDAARAAIAASEKWRQVASATQQIIDEKWRVVRDRDEAAARVATLEEALRGLVEATTAEVNFKGGGGYILARLADARAALGEPK